MELELVQLDEIWHDAPHNAFTDLIRFKQGWVCSFREASSHMSLDGIVRLIYSQDGVTWQNIGVLKWSGGDVRDPKLSISQTGELLVTTGVRLAVFSQVREKIVSAVWTLDRSFEVKGPFLDEFSLGTWRWAPSVDEGTYYCVGYAGKDIAGCLYTSRDGLRWQVAVKHFFPESNCFSNESSLVFTQDHVAYCLLRRDGKECPAMLGSSIAPYKKWQWHALPFSLGGPKMIWVASFGLVAAFRTIEDNSAQTVIHQIHPNGETTFLIQLPSAGDTSYPGMVMHNGCLWVSYYSSQQGHSAIYFAKLRIRD